MCLLVRAKRPDECVKRVTASTGAVSRWRLHAATRNCLTNPGLIGHACCFTMELEKVKSLLLILKWPSGILAA